MPKAIGVVAVLIVGAVVAMARGTFDADEAGEAEENGDDDAVVADTKPASTVETTVAVDASYKDGVYSTTGNYVAPSGPETIDVTMTVKDGAIADVSVVANATNAASKKFQAMFVDGCKMMVVGQKLSMLSLSKVSGSSLTPKGFNDAIAEIRTQASV